ncbi:hypothetical protein GH714_020047 [Hevea brasiliensis]|uniref:Proteasome subunit beta n=1 Tax=Hevea brasiliensis TaxID=3981 RepID=A0A6A6K6V4_HEVBR|nr:hypothetical protein GH714_020047 [Hevea brasiliensis]
MSVPTALRQVDQPLIGNVAVHFLIGLLAHHFLHRSAPDLGFLQPLPIIRASFLPDTRVLELGIVMFKPKALYDQALEPEISCPFCSNKGFGFSSLLWVEIFNQVYLFRVDDLCLDVQGSLLLSAWMILFSLEKAYVAFGGFAYTNNQHGKSGPGLILWQSLVFQNPYFVNILLAGYDKETGPSLYYIDYIATLHKVEKGAFGYGSYFSLSMMDRHFHSGMSVEEAIDLVDKCIMEIRSRLVVAPPNFLIKIVDKDGAREYAWRESVKNDVAA